MSLTNAFETHTLNYLLNATSVTRPTAWYVGLFTADPTDTGSLSNEISGNSYARRPVAFSVSGAVATNSAAVEFAAATGGNWGTITHIGVIDASTSGNMIVHSALAVSKAINVGDVFRIPTGDLDITAS
jgi:hypothetical protein|tara:strand:+ start:655 stop:1041 length:387 start_codon:yes stop_codon:yes gene_type:complete